MFLCNNNLCKKFIGFIVFINDSYNIYIHSTTTLLIVYCTESLTIAKMAENRRNLLEICNICLQTL